MQLPTDIAISTCRLTTTKTSQKSMETIEPLLSLLHQRGRGLLPWPRIWGDVGDHDHPACVTVPHTGVGVSVSAKNLSQLSAMWCSGHGESNAGISYMRGPNGESGPAISIIMADKYSDIDVDRGDDIVYCGSNSLDNTSSNTPADDGPPVRAPSIIMADKYSDIDVVRGDGIIYCGSNSLDNTSSNTPADGGPPVRGNAALFKPTEKNIRLVRICSKNPERQHERPWLRHSDDLQNSNDQVVGGYLQDLPDLEDLPDLDDLDAHLRDPSSFAFTGAEQSINFHTSFEGMPPNVFQDGVTNTAPPLAYGPATGHAAMWIFYTVKHGEHERDHEQLRSHG
ncbi:YDG/SRA domain-containing protein [Colletotrichum filicis]|nr:YDG/SRA domain-containing protein [Colletotrichum filicis]